jgi:subtilisin-like proprotein convertase family protein
LPNARLGGILCGTIFYTPQLSLRPLVAFAALRFKFFTSASTVIDRRYNLRESPTSTLFKICVYLCNLWFKIFPSASTVTDRRYKPFHPTFKIQHSTFPLLLGVLGVLAVNTSSFAATTWSQTWNVSTAIPDNDDVGFTDTRTINVPDITEIESVTVGLHFTGGWNGDLYAYLVHGSGFAVLLNRPGRSIGNSDGSGTLGMDVTLDDSAFSDIHTAIPMSGGEVTGTYQPDGRITDPYDTLDTDSRPALLASFIGLDASGARTLFVADQSAGETSTLESWTLTITGVPEPSTALLGGLGVLLLLRRRRC